MNIIMDTIYASRQILKYIFIVIAILIVVASGFISDIMIKDLAEEERKNMELWAQATRAMTTEGSSTADIDLIFYIIQKNTSIPVVWIDDEDNILSYNNIDLPETNVDEYLKKFVEKLKTKNPPFVIDLGDGVLQYVYYDDSYLLKRLLVYPYAQLTVVFVFIVIAFLALTSTKKAEQNKVWVGLSKETAHQLGTPISSLVAWIEYLRTKEMDPSLLNEMEKDVKRLETIADRFSKIGSNPDPTPVNINNSVSSALEYMGTRISSKVKLYKHLTEEPALVSINDSLFAWVIENIIKNAVDAMGGQGEITVQVGIKRKAVCIDISDTGKGIPKSRFKTIFNPGYTTKTRGWGLGLSLVKRIVESYHGGKIFVKNSELGKGTTFRIELRKYKG